MKNMHLNICFLFIGLFKISLAQANNADLFQANPPVAWSPSGLQSDIISALSTINYDARLWNILTPEERGEMNHLQQLFLEGHVSIPTIIGVITEQWCKLDPGKKITLLLRQIAAVHPINNIQRSIEVWTKYETFFSQLITLPYITQKCSSLNYKERLIENNNPPRKEDQQNQEDPKNNRASCSQGNLLSLADNTHLPDIYKYHIKYIFHKMKSLGFNIDSLALDVKEEINTAPRDCNPCLSYLASILKAVKMITNHQQVHKSCDKVMDYVKNKYNCPERFTDNQKRIRKDSNATIAENKLETENELTVERKPQKEIFSVHLLSREIYTIETYDIVHEFLVGPDSNDTRKGTKFPSLDEFLHVLKSDDVSKGVKAMFHLIQSDSLKTITQRITEYFDIFTRFRASLRSLTGFLAGRPLKSEWATITDISQKFHNEPERIISLMQRQQEKYPMAKEKVEAKTHSLGKYHKREQDKDSALALPYSREADEIRQEAKLEELFSTLEQRR